MFIGTADERPLRPHPFYQVHRITGKTVATQSREAALGPHRLLEMALLPDHGMTALIDCAGIQKLRNSDIELRKGETDIGRKNTRVRLVFRVHVPQPGGGVLSLQAASISIECSQRSAQELPVVERLSAACCSVAGGDLLHLHGNHFSPDARVTFTHRGADGRPLWEAEGRVDKESFSSTHLAVVVPPFHDAALAAPVPVQVTVSNGKQKRSQQQHYLHYRPHGSPATQPASQPLTQPLSHSLSHSPSHSLNHSPSHSPTQPLTQPPTHPPTHTSTCANDPPHPPPLPPHPPPTPPPTPPPPPRLQHPHQAGAVVPRPLSGRLRRRRLGGAGDDGGRRGGRGGRGGDVAGAPVAGVTVAGALVAGVTVAGVTVAGVTVAGVTVAGVTVAGVTVAGVTVAGVTVAGVTVAGAPRRRRHRRWRHRRRRHRRRRHRRRRHRRRRHCRWRPRRWRHRRRRHRRRRHRRWCPRR
ncbi:unnamed protein product, partial [Lampetra planeri]